MSSRVPETLNQVPNFHHQNAREVVWLGSSALADIASRSYDPATGEYGDSLRTIHREIVDVLDDVHAKTAITVENTHAAVLGLASGNTATRYQQAIGAPSLYSAVSKIEGAPAEATGALRAGLDSRIFREAFQAPSLYSARNIIDTHGSLFGSNLLRIGLEKRVYAKASGAVSLHAAVDTIAKHAVYGDALRRGLDVRVLTGALGVVSLHAAVDTIAKHGSTQTEKTRMRIVLDGRVEDRALSATSLYAAVDTIATHGSSKEAKAGMRTRLNEVVEDKALSASSVHAALSTTRTHAFGEGKEQIERKVAQKWLPIERKNLTKLQSSFEEKQQELNDIKKMNRFKRLVNFPKTRKLKIAARYYESRIKSTSATIAELSTILNPED